MNAVHNGRNPCQLVSQKIRRARLYVLVVREQSLDFVNTMCQMVLSALIGGNGCTQRTAAGFLGHFDDVFLVLVGQDALFGIAIHASVKSVVLHSDFLLVVFRFALFGLFFFQNVADYCINSILLFFCKSLPDVRNGLFVLSGITRVFGISVLDFCFCRIAT